MRIGKLLTRDQRVNPPTTRRAPRIDLRGGNPMVAEEDCLATCDGRAARTHAATSRKKGIMRIATG
jgi:hypothetical protein